MPTHNFPKKCICQLCTCGRHMCPHRKKTPPVKADGNQEVNHGTSDLSLATSDGKKQRKQWSLSNGKVDDPVTTSEATDGREVLSDATKLNAVSVTDQGNSNVGYTAQGKDFTSKQVSKTQSLRRSDNLKLEGNADFTTIQQQDFPSKSRNQHEIDSRHISTAADIKKESWNKRQIPKTQMIRKPDTLRFNGPVSLQTTHKAAYNERALEDSDYGDEKEDKISPKEIQNRTRPRTSLKLHGDFQSESSYQREYTPKRLEEDVKIRKDTTFDHLKPEGEMRFDTTSLDYNATLQSSRKGEGADDDIFAANLKFQRPQSGIKIPPDALSDETTATNDYKKWHVEKPVRYKPEDNIKVSDNRYGARAENTILSRNDTSQSEYKKWDMKSGRTMVMQPQNNLRPEGDFNFDTTHSIDYASNKGDRSRTTRLTSNLETYDEQYNKDVSGATSMKEEHLRNELQQESNGMKSSTGFKVDKEQNSDTLSRQMQSGLEYSSENQAVEPEIVEQAISHHDENQISSKNINEGNQNEQQYLTWDQIRPKPIRPHSNLRQEGGMEFSTTNRSEFIERSVERVKGVRPRTTTKLPVGDFEGVTMNQLMFSDDRGSRANPIRPKSNLHVEEGKFTSETTNSKEFQQWDIKRPLPIIHKNNLAQEGTMDFTTTNDREFEEKHPEKIHPFRPTTTNRVSSGEFDETTTNRLMHSQFPIERVKKIVPQSNLRTSSGIFETETTNRLQFQDWGFDRPNPIRPVSNLRQEGQMDFTTMNQTQFDEKTMEKVYEIRPHTSSKTTGVFDGTTTNQIMYPGQPLEKTQMIVPRGNMQMGTGQFSKNTTSNTEFKQWNQIKPLPITPQNNLHQEGDFDFTTTNQLQYNIKEIDRVSEIRPKSTSKMTGDFEGTTTNQVMFQNIASEKTQGIRPTTNIKLERGDFNGETTTDREFQKWGYSKPTAIKPRSSIRQEGNMDFTTMNNVQFEGTSGERVSEIRPTTSTKISGEFDGTTTNQLTFRNHPSGEKITGKRPSTNLQLERGKFEDQTTARREFQQWEISKPDAIRPSGNLAQEGDMDFTTSNQTQFETKPITRVEQFRPHPRSPEKGDFDGTTTNQVMFQTPLMERVHDFKPKDNIHVENGNFEDQTTSRREYGYKSSDKSDPIKPRPNLSQEGDFDFKTSNQMQFEQKPINKVQQIRPRTKTKMSEGKFYSTTTNQAMYQAPVAEPAQGIKPTNNLQLEEGKFQDTTTSNDEYRLWQADKPKAFQLVSSLKHEGDMLFETTNNSEFKERNLERVQQIRPRTTTKIEGNFESTTTNQAMFQQHNKLDRVKPIRQQNNLYVESGDFSNETTSRREFKQWVKMDNQATVPKSKLQAAGIRTQKDRRKGRKGIANETKVEKDSGTSRHKNGSWEAKNEVEDSNLRDESSEDQLKESNIQLARSAENKERNGNKAVRYEHVDSEENINRQEDTRQQEVNFAADENISFVDNGEVVDGQSVGISAEAVEQNQRNDSDITAAESHKSWKVSENDISNEQKERLRQEQGNESKHTTRNGARINEFDQGENVQSFLRSTPPIKPPKRFKPDDNLKIEHVPFDGTSTTRTEYKQWEARRSSSKKRSQTLRQEGKMEFKTTSNDYSVTEEYQNAKERIKVKSKAGLQGTLTQGGGMEFSTTSKSSYAGTTASKTKNLRPRSSLKVGGLSNTSSDNTTTRSNPETTASQSDQTTARADYVGHAATRTRFHRPTTSQKVGEGRFEGRSTTNSTFIIPPDHGGKTRSFKPENHKILNGGNGATGDTTYSRSFESKKHCPVTDLEQGRSQLFFNEEVDGHRFYLPRVQG